MGLKSRREIRSQIINRDAEVLYSLTLMEFNRAEEEALANPWLMDIGTDLLTVVLKTSEMKSVIAVRLFNREGQFIDALPLEFLKGELDGDEIRKARQLQPLSEYHSEVRLTISSTPSELKMTPPFLYWKSSCPCTRRAQRRLWG